MDPSALDPALSGAIDPALSGAGGESSAIDPALSGVLDPSLSSTTTTGAIDPSLFPAPLAHSHDSSVAAAYEVALGMQDPLPLAVAETDTPEERLKKLRSDYRAAAVSHWATLFLHHAGEEFDVEAFEKDLINTTPGADDQFLPHFLGRILNTLANDRNTNHTNWLNALRRSYNRRVSTREENPFYTWVRVPASVVEREKEEEREREEREYEEEMAKRAAGGGGEGEGKIKWEGEEERLREAERALGRKNRPKTEDAEAKPAVVHEAGAADVNMAVPSAEAAVPVTEEALDDGFNAELADVIGAEGVKEEVKGEGEEDEWYEEQRAVEWGSLGLETKLDAIYNVCEWHMVDPERQFRKYLQWDGESAWHRQRLDPLGVDSLGNKYYHLADDRLWVQRAPPQPNPLQPSSEDTQAGQVAGKKPKTLLGLRAGPRDKSKKGTVTGTVRVKLKRDAVSGRYLQVDEDSPALPSVDLPASGEGEDGEDGEGQKRSTMIEEDVEMPVWEREYWEERARAENTPGFVEWEALCITMDDWRAFPARFAGTTNADEIALVRKIEEEVIPGIEEDQARREEEAAARAAKRAALLASQETAAEEEARITAERLAHAERFSRSTRGVRTNYSEDSFGVAAAQHASSAPMAAGGSSAGSAPPPPPQESREERLKKREEEKRRAEEEEAARQAQEAWEVQREEARAANGGVLPVEYMNEEEREEYERGVEKERKKREAEERKRASEEKKKARAKERRAELKAERDAIAREEAEAEEAAAAQAAAAAARAHAQAQAQAAALAAVPPEAAAADDPWWMDCEICGLCGWNVDDGQELICCDECEEWQHLPCHVLADQQLGRPPQPFHDEDYKWACGRCQGLVPRTGRPPLPNPPNAPLQCVSAVTQVAQAGGKRRASDQNGRAAKGAKMPAAKKPKVAKQANGAQQSSIPYGHGAHPLYHPSAYSHPAAAMHTASASPGAQPAQQVAPSPPPQQQQAQPNEPMSYEQLKAMVESNPALLSQLPAEYQQHFSQLLGIPLS